MAANLVICICKSTWQQTSCCHGATIMCYSHALQNALSCRWKLPQALCIPQECPDALPMQVRRRIGQFLCGYGRMGREWAELGVQFEVETGGSQCFSISHSSPEGEKCKAQIDEILNRQEERKKKQTIILDPKYFPVDLCNKVVKFQYLLTISLLM